MRSFALILVLVLLAGMAFLFLDVRIVDPGRLPEVEVGVRDVGIERRTVEIPTVVVGD